MCVFMDFMTYVYPPCCGAAAFGLQPWFSYTEFQFWATFSSNLSSPQYVVLNSDSPFLLLVYV
jgi:hypothetical protein